MNFISKYKGNKQKIRMNNKKSIPVVAALFLLLSISCTGPLDSTRLKLAHGLPVDHPVHNAMMFMAERCKELSDGKLMIDVYPAEQLGSEKQCVELLQIGSLAITKVSAAVMESFAEDYKVFGLPYIFRSKEHAFQVLDGEIGRDLLLSTESKWIRGLCYYDAGSRSFYTKSKPINHPDDLSGLKMRVQPSITAVEMVRALGGSATPISGVNYIQRFRAVWLTEPRIIRQAFILHVITKFVSTIHWMNILLCPMC